MNKHIDVSDDKPTELTTRDLDVFLWMLEESYIVIIPCSWCAREVPTLRCLDGLNHICEKCMKVNDYIGKHPSNIWYVFTHTRTIMPKAEDYVPKSGNQ